MGTAEHSWGNVWLPWRAMLIFSSAALSTGQFFITSSNGVLYAFGK